MGAGFTWLPLVAGVPWHTAYIFLLFTLAGPVQVDSCGREDPPDGKGCFCPFLPSSSCEETGAEFKYHWLACGSSGEFRGRAHSSFFLCNPEKE